MKFLVIVLLALGIFGGSYYTYWRLYGQPKAAILAEKAAPPLPPPPDPSLPEYERVLALANEMDPLKERQGWQEFLDHYPHTTKLQEARERLGALNTTLYFSRIPTPEKTIYEVKRNDVITRVAARLESTPELIMRANDMNRIMLRTGEKLFVPPANFTLEIDRKMQKVIVLQHDRFFKQYDIVAMPAGHAAPEKAPAAKTPKITGKITEKIAWLDKTRITIEHKEFDQATFWIMVSGRGHNLYTEVPAEPGAPPPQKPAGGGYGLAPESMRELYALLRRQDAVTID